MYERELDAICRTAREAGELVMEYYRVQNYRVETKSDSSPVTDADRASDALIRKRLSEAFPAYPVLSEETADSPERLEAGCCFIVDPIDGTKEFVKHNGEFSINIAFCRGGRIVAGAVSVPARGELYYASEGGGAFLEKDGITDRIMVSKRKDDPRLAISRSHCTEGENNLIQQLGIKNIITAGSSYKGCLVAKGDAELYLRCGGTKEWDAAPLQVIIEEAGGVMRNLDGSRIAYNKEEPVHHPYFASNGLVFL